MIWHGLKVLSPVVVLAAVAAAQAPPGPAPAAANLTLPIDAELAAGLSIARRKLELQEWAVAVELLQRIVDAPEDSFLAPDNPVSLQEQALGLLRELPIPARQQYERLYTAAAESLHAEALRSDDGDPWRELARRYVQTSAGREAAWRLAVVRQDQGESLSAARLYELLLADPAARRDFGAELLLRAAVVQAAAGNSPRAMALLQLLAEMNVPEIPLHGQPVALPPRTGLTLDWLTTMQAAPPSTSAEAPPSAVPVLPPFLPPTGPPAWSVPMLCTDELLVLYPERTAELNRNLRELEREQQLEAQASGRLLLPAARPLVAPDRIVLRAPDRLSAWSPADGSVRWIATPVDFTYRELAESSEFSPRDDPTRTLYFGQRAWRDQTAAAVSSDDLNVYTVMDCGMLGAVDADMALQTTRHPKGPFRDNVLQAYSLRGGKQKWSIGGPAGVQPDDYAGLFFLGPPLVHAGRLYVLAEDRGQVRLLVLDPHAPDRPALLWSQAILTPPPQMSVEYDATRRTSGLTPLAVGDLVLCPTGAGTVVAVDVLRQRLAWAVQYRRPADEPALAWRGRRQVLQGDLNTRQRVALDKLLDAEGWRQTQLLPADDCALVAARDADLLVCLRLRDGAVLWQRPRGDGLYLAGVFGQHVVVVGRRTIEAFRRDNGEPAWSQPTPIPAPSGQGFTHGRLHTLALSTGEIATVALDTGRLLVRSPLPEGVVAGNLLAADGRLISLSATQLQVWPSLSAVAPALMAAISPDPSQLAARGELRLHGGDLAGGISDLRSAFAADNDPRVRRVLAAVLVEGLRTEFAARRSDVAEIERLLVDMPAEAEFRRMYAAELQSHGDLVEAFAQRLRLGEITAAQQDLESVAPELSVSPERRLIAQVSELLRVAGPADREQMLARLQERLLVILQWPDPDAQRRALQSLAQTARGTPLADVVMLQLARRSEADTLVRRAWLWQSLTGAAEAATSAEAIGQLAELYLRSGDELAAAPWVARLHLELQDTICRQGQTGHELLAAWSMDPVLRERLPSAVAAPLFDGEVEVIPDAPAGDLSSFRVLPVIGRSAGPFADWEFAYDDAQFRLLAFTPQGRVGWEAAVGSDAGVERSLPQAVMIRGALVLLLWEGRFQLIAGLTADGGRYRSVVGGKSLVAESADGIPFPIFQGRRDRMGRGLGLCGPLTSNLLCYQSGPDLVGLDPWTGEIGWQRSSTAGVSEILADDDYVVVRPSAEGELLILRAIDGQLIAKRPVPAETLAPPSGATWGRLLATLVSVDDRTDRWRMYDPVTDGTVWERTFASPVHWSTIDGGRLLIVDGDRRCLLLDPADGRELLNVPLPVTAETEPWESLAHWADSERVYVVLNRRQQADGLRFDRYLSSERTVNGRLCALDRRTGTVAWTVDIEGQSVDPQLPSEWPVLILGAYQRAQDSMVSEFVRLVLDKRTGAVIHQSRAPSKPSGRRYNTQVSWRVSGDPPVLRMVQPTGVLEIRPRTAAPDSGAPGQ